VPYAPNEPKSLEERIDVAKDCLRAMKVTIPFLIDDMKNGANEAYTARPDRIYVVDKSGKIAYKGAPGPRGFNPNEAKGKLRELVPN